MGNLPVLVSQSLEKCLNIWATETCRATGKGSAVIRTKGTLREQCWILSACPWRRAPRDSDLPAGIRSHVLHLHSKWRGASPPEEGAIQTQALLRGLVGSFGLRRCGNLESVGSSGSASSRTDRAASPDLSCGNSPSPVPSQGKGIQLIAGGPSMVPHLPRPAFSLCVNRGKSRDAE